MRKSQIIRDLLTVFIIAAFCFCVPAAPVSAKSGTAVKIKVGNKFFDTSYEYTEAAGKNSITVSSAKKKKIRLSEKELTLNPGNSKTIKLKGASGKKVKWSTSDKKTATVSKGRIRAKKPGSVMITAKYKNRKYKCKVVVREKEKPAAERIITMKINDKNVAVDWEDNESVAALKDFVSEKPLTIRMSMYGGFEQVGPIGSNLPRNDVQTTTSAGDIVLYSGNQIVVFYGSNSWAYTRLGHISDQDAAGMTDLLSHGNVTITISLDNM